MADHHFAFWNVIFKSCITGYCWHHQYHGNNLNMAQYVCNLMHMSGTFLFDLNGPVQNVYMVLLDFTYVLGFVVLRDVVKVFPVSSSFGVCEKDDHGTGNQACDKVTGSGAFVGIVTRPKDEMGSQIVSSESDTSHPILVYLSRNNSSLAQARRGFPAESDRSGARSGQRGRKRGTAEKMRGPAAPRLV